MQSVPLTDQAPAGHTLNLKLCDVLVRISSDASYAIRYFAHLYGRFQVSDFSAEAQPPVEFALLTSSDNAWGRPVLVLDETAWPLDGALGEQGFVYDVVLNAILARVRSHLLIHAAVVAKDGQAILLSGDSGHGKTTLALALVRRGYQFLSDELAALGRSDNLVHPFPRRLRVRPGTLERAGWAAFAGAGRSATDPLLIDIEELQPGCLGSPAPIKQVFILQPAPAVSQPLERELGLYLDRMDPRLLAVAQQLPGVTQVWETVESGCPVLRLITSQRMAALPELEQACHNLGILILDVSKRPLNTAVFDQSAELMPISQSAAVMELIRQFQPGHKSALLAQASSTQLFIELAAMLNGAAAYRLRPGTIEANLDLISRLS